jgi:transposase
VAADGLYLLRAVFSDSASTPPWLREVPAVQTLWRVWLQNFTWDTREKPEAPEGSEGSYPLRFRSDEELPLGRHFINSPFDIEARLSRKRNTYWVGFEVVLSETCEADLPMLITNIQTTPATTQDFDTVTEIHTHLRSRPLLPEQHLVDMGFMSAKLLVESQRDYSVDLVGPARHDQHRQAWEQKGFAAEHFKIDWEAQHLTCPEGKVSTSWSPMTDKRGKERITIHFSNRDCQPCPFKSDCTTGSRRTIAIQARPQHEAMIAARARENTEEFKELYAKRAGIEGTISLGTRNFGIRRSRYVGMAKTHLQHLATASAINLIRVADWLADRPRAQTRRPRFERVLLAAA